jgi:hypothetical protein
VHTSLVTLDISFARLKDSAFGQIASAIAERGTLTSLNVGGNELSANTVKSFTAVLGRCPLCSLSIGARELDSFDPAAVQLGDSCATQLTQVLLLLQCCNCV